MGQCAVRPKLARTFGRQIGKAGDTHAVWECAVNSGFDEIGARKASKIVRFTLRTLHCSRLAKLSTLVVASVMSSLSQRRPRAIDATKSGRAITGRRGKTLSN